MRVQKIDNFSHKVSFCAQKNKRNPLKSMSAPMQDGISTAGAWFGFGVILDFISRKCHFFESPVKNSIAMNGVIGLGAGAITCAKDKFTKSTNNSKNRINEE